MQPQVASPQSTHWLCQQLGAEQSYAQRHHTGPAHLLVDTSLPGCPVLPACLSLADVTESPSDAMCCPLQMMAQPGGLLPEQLA